MGRISTVSLISLKQLFVNVNWRGELISTAICFGGISLIRLISSITLTRLLYPEAYGIVAMMSMVAFVIEMMSDIGIVALLIGHPRGAEPNFLHTLWSVRVLRGVLNGSILFAVAPLIATWYQTPLLESGLRIYSVTFLIRALESMSFLLAIRDQRSRVVSFAELLSTLCSTIFVIVFSYFSRDHYGMIFGMIVNAVTMVAISYIRNDRVWPKLMLEKDAVVAVFGFAKYVGPSSFVTIFVSQFDKAAILKLFDLKLMGLYGVASGVAGPVESLVIRISRMVLYPRCASYFREDLKSVRQRFYHENYKLFALILCLPAAMSGLAHPLVQLLFDNRYAGAAMVIQAFCLRGMLLALSSPSEDLLVASGQPKIVLLGNLLRLLWIVPVSLLGYWVWGFVGFVWGASLDVLPVMLFYWYRRHMASLLIVRYEALMVAFITAVWVLAWLLGLEASVLITHWRLR
jgi:O-antigen/teichoic acid export membrane protein